MKNWKRIMMEALVGLYIAVIAFRVGFAATPDYVVEEERETVQEAQVPLATMFPMEPELDADAIAMAKVLYGQCRWNSENAQRAVAWLIINRVESSLYPDSISEVCSQKSQWMGEGNKTYTEDLYQLSLEVITTWRAGGMRPVGADFLFLRWSQSEVELRTSFNETNSTRYWRVE